MSAIKNRNLNNHDNWATPDWLYQELDAEFDFDFDPCPLNLDEITPDVDGLVIPWGKRNFVNPPYGRKLKDAFVKRSIEEARTGSLCVCLIPVSTSTALFHDYIQPNATEIRFLRGRIKFTGTDTRGVAVDPKNPLARPMHDSMVVVFDGRVRS